MDLGSGVVVIGVVIVAALAQTVCGFGFSVLVVPPLGLVIGPADAVAVALVLLVISCGLLVASEHRDLDRRAAAWLLVGAMLGLPFGLAALRAASADALRIGLAAAVLVTLAVVVTGRPTLGHGRPTLLIGGLLTGALTTSLTTNGPPTVLALQGHGLSPASFRPTVSVVLGLASTVGVAMFAADGRLGGDVRPALAVGVPALLAGWAVGLVVRPRVSVDRFRRAVLVLLLLGALLSLAPVVI
jgi:uncharacterized membrane protein YfcA